jgi:hypothetical protein
MQPARSISATVASTLVACALLGAAACEQQVNLGAIGDGGASLLWTATFEPGDLSEWLGDGKGGTYVDNATVAPAATLDAAHRGQHAGLATVAPAGGMPSLNYLFRDQPSPPEAYYSAWFYKPTSYLVRSWLSLTHFRSSQSGDGNNLVAIWDVNLYSRPDGSLIAHLFDYTKGTNVEQANPIPVPVGRWFQFEVLLRKAADATGHVAVWQDGVLILDDPNVPTAPTDWVQWDAGGSSGDIVPSPATIYIDDAAISLSRIGNQGG